MPKSAKGRDISVTLIDSLRTALETSDEKPDKRPDSTAAKIEGIPVIVETHDKGVRIHCSNKEKACEHLKKLSVQGAKDLEVCEQMHGSLSHLSTDSINEVVGLTLMSIKKNGNNHNGHKTNLIDATVISPAELGVEQISNFLKESNDLQALKKLKKVLTSRIRTLLGNEPEKSYKKKVRNGREYWYEVWWDPIKKKKVDHYIGTKPPDIVIETNT